MTLQDWHAQAWAIERRRIGAPKYEAARRHLGSFPANDVLFELDIELLRTLVELFEGTPRTLFARPLRGHRGTAPQTTFIVTLKNRIMRLEAAGVGGNQMITTDEQ